MEPTKTEMQDQLAKADDQIMEGNSKWPGMTFEEGVSHALRWAVGDDDVPPMDGDER